MNNTLKKFIRNPGLIFKSLGHREFLNWIPDSLYLKISYYISTGSRLHLKEPKTYNEKLQWLKLNYRRPIMTQCADKYEVRSYIDNTIGSGYLIPLVGGPWNSFEEIDFSKLPDRFVLKCTHDSGGLVICKDKSRFDIQRARYIIEKCLKHNFYWGGREWPYKDISPRIIAEAYMEDSSTHELRDYKFFCFDGRVKALFIASERQSVGEETKFDFFDSEFRHLPFTNGHPNAKILPQKPLHFEEMKSLAEKLSAEFPHARVDFYEVNGNVYFGEITFYHWSGMMPFEPQEWDELFGDWLKLPE